MQGEETQWRQEIFLENMMTIQNYPRMEGVRTHQWKYIRYFDRRNDSDYSEMINASIDGEKPLYEELFDLVNDAEEKHNVINDPANAAILKQLRSRTLELVEEYRGTEPLKTHVNEGEAEAVDPLLG